MKNLIILLIASFCMASFAIGQDAILTSSATYKTAGGATGDTIDASATVTKTFQYKTGEFAKYSTAVFLDKVSGTPDTVFIDTYGSHDGTNFTTAITVDTIVTGNADKYTIFRSQADLPYRYVKYRVRSDGDTMKMTVTLESKMWRQN